MDEIRISQSDLSWAAREGYITHGQAGALWPALAARARGTSPPPKSPTTPKFEMVHLFYYGGAAILLFALTVGLLQFYEALGGFGVAGTTAVYGLGFGVVAAYLWRRNDLKTVGGIFATLSVVMVPMSLFGLELAAGWFDQFGRAAEFKQHLPLELATIAASLLALRYIRFGFLTAPLALAAYALMMDVAWFTLNTNSTWLLEMHLTMFFGAILMLGALVADVRNRSEYDFGFWGYLFGATAFALGLNGLTWFQNGGLLVENVYLGINVVMMVASVLVSRPILRVYGSLGIGAYLLHFTWVTFKDSPAFLFILAAVGIGIIILGIVYQKNQERIERGINRLVPAPVRKWLPKR
jgi:hypothetical protein